MRTDYSLAWPLKFAASPTAAADVQLRRTAAGQLTLEGLAGATPALGIGAGPSAWDSVMRAVELGSGAIRGAINFDITGYMQMSTNAYYSASGWTRQVTYGAANYYQSRDGEHVWRVAPSGSGAITWTEAMRISPAGNVGIGGTPTSKLGVNGTIQVTGAGAPTAGAGVEISYASSNGYIGTYDRTAGGYRTTIIWGSEVRFETPAFAATIAGAGDFYIKSSVMIGSADSSSARWQLYKNGDYLDLYSPSTASNWNLRAASWGNATYGYMYGDTAGWGLLNGAHNWAIRCVGSTGGNNTSTEFYVNNAVRFLVAPEYTRSINVYDGRSVQMGITSYDTTNNAYLDSSGIWRASVSAGASLCQLSPVQMTFYTAANPGAGGALSFTQRAVFSSTDNWIAMNGGRTMFASTATPGYTVDVNGSVHGTVAYNTSSDARLKKNIAPLALSDARRVVNDLRAVEFEWKEGDAGGGRADISRAIQQSQRQLGFVAQDVLKVLPEAVSKADNEEGLLAVMYEKLIPIHHEMLREQDRERAALCRDRDALRRQVDELYEAFPELVDALERQDGRLRAVEALPVAKHR
jgi:hypothetical protein